MVGRCRGAQPAGLKRQRQMQFLAELFIWWHGQTLGTRFFTWLHGVPVGTDEAGNRYYKSKRGDRRWVIYQGRVDASQIPPGWHGWIHHRTDQIPGKTRYTPRFWEQPHQSNQTGTAQAYRPDSSLLGKGRRPRVSADYDAWSP